MNCYGHFTGDSVASDVFGFRGKDRSMTTTFVSKKSTLILNDIASVLEMASQPTVRGRNECS